MDKPSLVTSSEANQLYTCSKMQNFAFDDIHHGNICAVHLYCCVFEFISFNQQLVIKGCVKKKLVTFFQIFRYF